MLALNHRNARSQRAPAALSTDIRLRQIAIVTSMPAISAGAARLFCALVAAADDEGRAMLRPRELAAMAGNAVAADWAVNLLRELQHHRLLDYDSKPRMATAVKLTLTGEMLAAEADAMARRLRESRREPLGSDEH